MRGSLKSTGRAAAHVPALGAPLVVPHMKGCNSCLCGCPMSEQFPPVARGPVCSLGLLTAWPSGAP